jgi:glutathione synthase/RimK-type ligase-like ATP-grasp enzyme
MRTFDVVILTESRYLNPEKVNNYIQNILTEEGLLIKALEKHGLSVIRKDWADPDFDWSSTKCALFRTTWDYFDRFEEFKFWLNQVDEKTQCINPISQIKWNMDKHYLKDLKDKGIRIVETEYIHRGDKRALHSIFTECGWDDVILKPTVAGAARHTYKLNADNISDHEDIFSTLIAKEDMMLQPFQYNIEKKGEVSFMVMGGKFTHAILKKAKSGDFRVQDDFGGTVHNYEVSKEEIAFAERVINACEPLPFYGRVDVMWDNEDKLAVSEVELIEPELWFRENNAAADSLAREVKTLISK